MFLLEIYSTKDQHYILISGGTSGGTVGARNRVPILAVALAKGLQQFTFSAYFLGGQGYSCPPIIVYQDILSTIKMIENGRSTSKLTRHIEIVYSWVQDLVDRGLISIV